MRTELDRVICALDDKKYKWRTISGVSKATGISPERVKQLISENSGLIIQSSALSPAGESLFATRSKHSKEASTWEKIGSALRNRAD